MDGRRIKRKRRRGRLIKTLLIKTGKILQTTALRGREQSAKCRISKASYEIAVCLNRDQGKGVRFFAGICV